MSQSFRFQEDGPYDNLIEPDERILNMMRTLKQINRQNKDFNVTKLRDLIPKLYNILYKNNDQMALKTRGIWLKKPMDWPDNVFFGDPNNKKSPNTKPNKVDLMSQFKFLMSKFNNKYKNLNSNESFASIERSLSISVLQSNDSSITSHDYPMDYEAYSLNLPDSVSIPEDRRQFNTWTGNYDQNNYYDEGACGGSSKCLELGDENHVSSRLPAQPDVLPNLGSDKIYQELNSVLMSLTEKIDPENFKILQLILLQLTIDKKSLQLQIFQVILNNILLVGSITEDITTMINQNFGDIIKNREMKVAEEDRKFDSGLFESSSNIWLREGDYKLSDFMDLAFMDDLDLQPVETAVKQGISTDIADPLLMEHMAIQYELSTNQPVAESHKSISCLDSNRGTAKEEVYLDVGVNAPYIYQSPEMQAQLVNETNSSNWMVQQELMETCDDLVFVDRPQQQPQPDQARIPVVVSDYDERKKEKSTDCDSALIQLLCVHG